MSNEVVPKITTTGRTTLAVKRFDREDEGVVIGNLNNFLLTIDPVDIVKIDFSVENDEYGQGHSVVHVVYKQWVE